MGAGVDLAGDALHRAGAHDLQAQVDEPLLRGEQIGVDHRQPGGQRVDVRVEFVGRDRFQREADPGRLHAADAVAAEEHALGPLRAHVVEPHLVRRRALGAGGGEPDHGVVGDDDEVAEQRDVGAAGQAVAVHLGDDRLVHVEQRHLVALRFLHAPGVVVDAGAAAVAGPGVAAAGGDVVAGAERAAGAAQHGEMHVGAVVGLPERLVQLLQEVGGEGVELLGAVERDVGHAAAFFVADVVEFHWGSLCRCDRDATARPVVGGSLALPVVLEQGEQLGDRIGAADRVQRDVADGVGRGRLSRGADDDQAGPLGATQLAGGDVEQDGPARRNRPRPPRRGRPTAWRACASRRGCWWGWSDRRPAPLRPDPPDA